MSSSGYYRVYGIPCPIKGYKPRKKLIRQLTRMILKDHPKTFIYTEDKYYTVIKWSK